jgi:hypothetical protein
MYSDYIPIKKPQAHHLRFCHLYSPIPALPNFLWNLGRRPAEGPRRGMGWASLLVDYFAFDHWHICCKGQTLFTTIDFDGLAFVKLTG